MQDGMIISLDKIGPRIFIPGYITPNNELVLESLVSLQDREIRLLKSGYDLFRKQAHEVVSIAKSLGYDSAKFSINQQSVFAKPISADIVLHRTIPDDSAGIDEKISWTKDGISATKAKISKSGRPIMVESKPIFTTPASALHSLWIRAIPSTSFTPKDRWCIAKRSRRDHCVFIVDTFYDQPPKRKLDDGEYLAMYSGKNRTHAQVEGNSRHIVELVKPVIRKLVENSSRESDAIDYVSVLVTGGKYPERFRVFPIASRSVDTVAVEDLEDSVNLYLVKFRSDNGLTDFSKEALILARKICPKQAAKHLPDISRIGYSKKRGMLAYKCRYYSFWSTRQGDELLEHRSKNPIPVEKLSSYITVQQAMQSIYDSASMLGLKVALDLVPRNLATEHNDISSDVVLLDPIKCLSNNQEPPKVGAIKRLFFKACGGR